MLIGSIEDGSGRRASATNTNRIKKKTSGRLSPHWVCFWVVFGGLGGCGFWIFLVSCFLFWGAAEGSPGGAQTTDRGPSNGSGARDMCGNLQGGQREGERRAGKASTWGLVLGSPI